MSLTLRAFFTSLMLLTIGLALPVRQASAMEIPLFDRMSPQDQHEYVKYLVAKAERVLVERKESAPAAQLKELFGKAGVGGVSAGEKQFMENLTVLRRVLAEPPTMAGPPTVESALVLTLSKNHIKMWGNFTGALQDRLREEPFWPKSSLRGN